MSSEKKPSTADSTQHPQPEPDQDNVGQNYKKSQPVITLANEAINVEQKQDISATQKIARPVLLRASSFRRASSSPRKPALIKAGETSKGQPTTQNPDTGPSSSKKKNSNPKPTDAGPSSGKKNSNPKTPPAAITKKQSLKGEEEFIEVTLSKKTQISPDTFIFRFALPDPTSVLGLPTGKHVQIRAVIKNEEVLRTYTPISTDDDIGYVDLLIKVYFKGKNKNFPEGGLLSQYINNLKIGQKLSLRGPRGRLMYDGNGKFLTKSWDSTHTEFTYKRINMIAGGSGITPMYQIVRAVLKNPKDPTLVAMIFSNHTEDDILCRSELEQLSSAWPNRFKIWFTVTGQAKPGWKFGVGRVNKEMLTSHLYPPSKDTLTLICGPGGFQEATENLLGQIGYPTDTIHIY